MCEILIVKSLHSLHFRLWFVMCKNLGDIAIILSYRYKSLFLQAESLFMNDNFIYYYVNHSFFVTNRYLCEAQEYK